MFFCQLLREVQGEPPELVSGLLSSEGTGLPSSTAWGGKLNSLTSPDPASGAASALHFSLVPSDQQRGFRRFKFKISQQSSCLLGIHCD